MVTNLIAEIANSYYELLALDNELDILEQNIKIQSNALSIVKQQKQAARVTELAVRRFEAQVLNIRGLKFRIQQNIVETENRINFLLGRFPQPIQRDASGFVNLKPDRLYAGVPVQLLENRPDIKQAEYELEAAKLDVKVAKARFYPSLSITAGAGLEGINPAYFIKTPEAMLYSLAGELTAPLINRKGIQADYNSANARQLKAVYNYEQTILKAYVEVVNQQNMLQNLEKTFDLKEQEVEALNESVKISNRLFASARADYMEILLTQRDALESKFQLIETKERQMNAFINMYKTLGGGWR
jgi:NodT family efflux transporter outer membrane factor (OMF) lipoprotein